MRSSLIVGLMASTALAQPKPVTIKVDDQTITVGGAGGGTINVSGGGIGVSPGGGSGGGSGSSGKEANNAAKAPGESAAAPQGEAQAFIATVGGGADVFLPNSLTAPPGSKVEFQFNTGNHTATQGSLDGGCQPLANGFHSGHIPYKDGQQEVGTFTLQINDTNPIAVICTTGPHRQNGQVMVINGTPEQLSTFSKTCMAAELEKNEDGKEVVGGVVGTIALAQAKFSPLKGGGKKGPPPPGNKSAEPGAEPGAGNKQGGEGGGGNAEKKSADKKLASGGGGGEAGGSSAEKSPAAEKKSANKKLASGGEGGEAGGASAEKPPVSEKKNKNLGSGEMGEASSRSAEGTPRNVLGGKESAA